jgi:hypothetical protein
MEDFIPVDQEVAKRESIQQIVWIELYRFKKTTAPACIGSSS